MVPQNDTGTQQRVYWHPLGGEAESALDAQWTACRQAASVQSAPVILPIMFGRTMHIAADQVRCRPLLLLSALRSTPDARHFDDRSCFRARSVEDGRCLTPANTVANGPLLMLCCTHDCLNLIMGCCCMQRVPL